MGKESESTCTVIFRSSDQEWVQETRRETNDFADSLLSCIESHCPMEGYGWPVILLATALLSDNLQAPVDSLIPLVKSLEESAGNLVNAYTLLQAEVISDLHKGE